MVVQKEPALSYKQWPLAPLSEQECRLCTQVLGPQWRGSPVPHPPSLVQVESLGCKPKPKTSAAKDQNLRGLMVLSCGAMSFLTNHLPERGTSLGFRHHPLMALFPHLLSACHILDLWVCHQTFP